jgi:PAS domain S-box-containing protein
MTSDEERASLRQQAEDRLQKQSPGREDAAAPEPAESLLHELQVHQIELEMQNDELREAQAQLETSHSRYFDLYDLAPVGYITLGARGLILEANLAAATLLGVDRRSLVKQPITRFLFPEDQDIYYLHHKRLAETGVRQVFEVRVARSGPGGASIWARLEAVAAQLGEAGAPVCRIMMSDITAQKEAERERERLLVELGVAQERGRLLEALRESQAVLTMAESVAQIGSWKWDLATNKVAWSDEMFRLFGIDRAEFDGDVERVVSMRVHPDDLPAVRQANAGVLQAGQPTPMQYRICLPDGTQRILWAEGRLVRDASGQAVALTGYVQDITERVRIEAELNAALAEKEMLMREIYHRVKNNIQTLIYLLEWQAEYVSDPDIRTMIGELQERARTMALVHEKLYQTHNLTHIDFGAYLNDLVSNLSHAFGAGQAIAWRVDADDVMLGVDMAIPCGLIVNELLTNALKYAFPDRQPIAARGESDCAVSVEFRAEGDQLVLRVSDNGIGLPPGVESTATHSLGMQLINILARHQLGGQIEVDRRAGTAFTITFAPGKRRTMPAATP